MSVACHHRKARSSRRGVVLLVVLVVVTVLMLIGYSYFHLMQTEHQAVEASNRVMRGRTIADSGLHYAAFVLAYPPSRGMSDGADSVVISPAAIYDNAAVFHALPVPASNPRHQGYFSIVARRDADDPLALAQGYRFGVEDESAKINLNALLRLDPSGKKAKDMLVKLPNMTNEIAESILNWVRPATSTTETAAGDSAFYATLGYSIKNGPIESLEELMLVRGITPRLLLGNDANRNGTLDPDEDDNNGALDPGLMRYVTIYSRERNLDSQGQPRIWVNDDSDLQGLYEKLTAALGEDVATFIVAYRLYGPAAGGTGGRSTRRGQGVSRSSLDFSKGRNGGAKKINSLMELIKASVNMDSGGKSGSGAKSSGGGPDSQANILYSPFVLPDNPQTLDMQAVRTKLPLLLDKVTTSQDTELAPRININTAPREVLLALPGLSETDVQAILDLRPSPDMEPAQTALFRTSAWLLSEAGFQPNLVQQLEPYITTRSQVFRVQVVGYYEMGGPVTRLEAVVDTTGGQPRFLYWRDITDLGGGFDPRTWAAMPR